MKKFHFILKHKSNAQNRVADILSRIAKLLSVIRMEVLDFDALKDLYANDPYFASILQEVQAHDRVDYQLHDDFLFHGVALYSRLFFVGEDCTRAPCRRPLR